MEWEDVNWEWNSIVTLMSEFMILIVGTLLYVSIMCIWYLVNEIPNNSAMTNHLLGKLYADQQNMHQTVNFLNAKIKMDITDKDK